jgi:ABC-2 type transport system permease protein
MTNAETELRVRRLKTEPMQRTNVSRGFFSGFVPSIREILSHRELIGLLVGREVKSRYKDSKLGFVWSLIRPLLQLAIYYIAIGKILGASRAIPDFAVFVFIGLTLWGLFAEIISSGTSSLLSNAGLVKKVYVPREVFPLSSVGSAAVNFAMQFVVLIFAVVFLSETKPVLSVELLYVPTSILTIILFGLAVIFFTSALNVYLRDTQYLVEVALLLLFWLTPIVYSFTYVHQALQGSWIEQVYLASPITISVLSMQKALWGAGATGQYWPENLPVMVVTALIVSTILLFIAQRFFARVQGNFAQEL